jgi:hypothetical protein
MAERQFADICQRVRFSLDEPIRTEDLQGSVADLVAQVRANGLQVTRTTVPRIASVVERVCQRVGLEGLAETYIVNDPSSNAFVPLGGGLKRPVVILTSGLVTLLDVNELAFAVGHELGHYGFKHAQKEGSPDETELDALQRRSAQRYTEVSADRVGLLATGSVFVAAKVMVKIASGLPAELLGLDVDAFIRQAERDPDELSREWELNATHPSLPLRMWALIRFAHSGLFARLSGQGRGGQRIEEIDQDIEQRMALLGDGRLSEVEQKHYETALVWAAAALVIEDGRIDRSEQVALARLIGPEKSLKVIHFASTHGRVAVVKKLMGALERLNSAGAATRRKFDDAFGSFSLVLSDSDSVPATVKVVRRALRLS